MDIQDTYFSLCLVWNLFCLTEPFSSCIRGANLPWRGGTCNPGFAEYFNCDYSSWIEFLKNYFESLGGHSFFLSYVSYLHILRHFDVFVHVMRPGHAESPWSTSGHTSWTSYVSSASWFGATMRLWVDHELDGFSIVNIKIFRTCQFFDVSPAVSREHLHVKFDPNSYAHGFPVENSTLGFRVISSGPLSPLLSLFLPFPSLFVCWHCLHCSFSLFFSWFIDCCLSIVVCRPSVGSFSRLSLAAIIAIVISFVIGSLSWIIHCPCFMHIAIYPLNRWYVSEVFAGAFCVQY